VVNSKLIALSQLARVALLSLSILLLTDSSTALGEEGQGAPSPAATASKNILDSKLFSGKVDNGPTLVTSNSLTLNSEERTFEYQGDVKVVHGDMTLTADTIHGTYSDKNEIQTITAQSNVHIDKTGGLKAQSEKAVYDAEKGTVEMTENPSIEQEGSILSADLITIFLNENRSVASGQVRVKLIKKSEDGAKPAVTPTP